jgi:hypothetical protein
MRLLKFDGTSKLSLTEDLNNDIPPYAILSHTWGRDEDEVTFDDLMLPSDKSKAGYNKIRFCGEQARKDGLEYFWVDTCCINKADQTEYSKSINSMYRWYRNAERCYVYLSDVSVRRTNNSDNYQRLSIVEHLRRSRWFTRGWTLQELIAPAVVEFYSQEGELLGNKETFEQLLYEITEIPITALRGVPLTRFTLDERIQWAAKRETKKEEDRAYCLFGILNLYLPVFYGEGEKAIQRLKAEFDRSRRSRCDLDKMPYVPGAMYDSNDINHEACHPATRVDLLNQIQAWALDPQSKSIFWLNGMAGTGKSTISLTIARWLAEQGRHGVVDLGASFFFKRGEGDRGKATHFFLTIARSLGLMVSGMDHEIANEITTDFSIYHKALGEQFDKLIYRPLQKVKITLGTCPILVVAVDALDECENERDIDTLLDLWSRLPQITSVRLKLFLTSRPELPIRLKFNSMAPDAYRDMILQNAVPQATIQQDITVYLRDQFSKIREDHNVIAPREIHLANDWPGHRILQELVDMAVPLFIVAATVCRFVRDPNWDPQEQLEKIQELRRVGDLEQMEQTYLPILKHLHGGLTEFRDRERLYDQFRTIVGAIISLAEPLSATSLATLLNMSLNAVTRRLYPLHSVLQIPINLHSPIRTLHLSFPEFLLSDRCQQEPFGVNGPATHRMLLTKCLNLLSGSSGLRENMCGLRYPGQRRQEVDRATLDKCLPPVMQYACRYWVHHIQYSMIQILDDDQVHQFLQTHFLHWVEALSFMDRVSEVIQYLGVLESVITVRQISVREGAKRKAQL